MLKKLNFLQTFISLSMISIVLAQANKNYIVYTPDEMRVHKKNCIEKIAANPLNHYDSTYQMKRTLLTISADDADYIPKIVGAGDIFKDGTVSYQLMHNGTKIVLNCYYDVQWLTDVIHALKGHHEPQEEKCFYEVLKFIPDNATMIELGSYWAYYSLWFASKVNNAKNYLIEPDPRRLEVGRKNFMLNNKTAKFKRGFLGRVYDEIDAVGAEFISIDDFIQKEGIEHVNILHSDIQGAEYEMLQTAVKNLNNIDYFFISTHSNEIHRNCLNFFNAHHITILAEHSLSESCSADGLIVAKRKGVTGPEHITIKKYKP